MGTIVSDLLETYKVSGLQRLFDRYSYEEGPRQAMMDAGGKAKWSYLKAYCAVLTDLTKGIPNMRFWPAVFVGKGHPDFWDILYSADQGSECAGPGMYHAAAVLRALLESFPDMDDAASLLLMLPDTSLFPQVHSPQVYLTEQHARAAARAWLECGGKAALLPEAYGWVGL